MKRFTRSPVCGTTLSPQHLRSLAPRPQHLVVFTESHVGAPLNAVPGKGHEVRDGTGEAIGSELTQVQVTAWIQVRCVTRLAADSGQRQRRRKPRRRGRSYNRYQVTDPARIVSVAES
jgi:hypothetical protein